MKARIARSVFWILWSRGGIQLVSFLSTLLVARLLTPGDYGLMALMGTVTSVVAVLSEMGMGAAIVQFRDLEHSEVNACFWLTFLVALLGYVGIYAAAPTAAVWFRSPQLQDLFRFAALSLILIAVRVVPNSLLRRELRLDRISQAEIVSILVTVPVTVGLALRGAGVWALAAAAVLAPLVQTLLTFYFVRWTPRLRISSRRLPAIMKYSLATLGTRLCWATYSQADAFLLGKIGGGNIVGLFSMSKQLALLPVDKVASVVNQISVPVLARFQGQPEAMREAVVRSIRAVSCVTFPLSAGLMLVAEDFIAVTFTEKWADMAPVVQLLCFYGILRSVDVLLPPVLMARYRTTLLLVYTITLLAVMPMGFLAGALWAQGFGVALAWVTVYPSIVVWMAREALREVDLSWSRVFVELRPTLTATLGMVAMVALVSKAILPRAGYPPLARLAATVGIGVAAYLSVLFAVGGPILADAKEVLGWALRGSRRVSPVNAPVG